MYDDGNQSICLPYSPFVFIRCIKPIKIHLKAHKIGFHHNFKSPNCNFGPRHMDWNDFYWDFYSILRVLRWVLMGFMHTIQGFHWGLLDGGECSPPEGGILGDGGGNAPPLRGGILGDGGGNSA